MSGSKSRQKVKRENSRHSRTGSSATRCPAYSLSPPQASARCLPQAGSTHSWVHTSQHSPRLGKPLRSLGPSIPGGEVTKPEHPGVEPESGGCTNQGHRVLLRQKLPVPFSTATEHMENRNSNMHPCCLTKFLNVFFHLVHMTILGMGYLQY